MIVRAGWALALGCLACLQSTSAFARQDVVPGSRYTSARAAALGDAFLPIGDDGAAALFYNPAVMGKLRGVKLEPMNISLMGNSGFASGLGLNSFKITSLSSNLSNLQSSPGVFQGVGATILPTYYTRFFSVGLLAQEEFVASYTTSGNVRYKSNYQLIPALATGVRLAGGIVRLGYSIQWVNKAEGDVTVPTDTDPLGYNQSIAQGSGFSHTVGGSLTLPITYLPQFNVVVRNALNTVYMDTMLYKFTTTSSGTPATELMTFDGSLSIQPKIGSGVYSNLILQYRDFTNRSGVSLFGRLCAGAEISFRDVFFLRGGWGSGYPSAGIGLRRRQGEFSFTWYSEEIGSSYLEQRDPRYLLQYQVRAF